VVDNCSTDGSPALVRHEFPGVTLLEPGANLGFAAGTNQGIRYLLQEPGIKNQELRTRNPAINPSLRTPDSALQDAIPELILLLNPDTVVHPGAIETLADFLERHPRVGVAGPRLLNPDGSRQVAAFRFPTLTMTALDLFPPGEVLPGRLYNSWWHGRYPQEQDDVPFPIDHPLGACMLVRRCVIEQVGLLDEGYFMYAEEVDWCLRIRQAGWAIWQTPAARVTHVGGAATRTVRARMLTALYESRMRFFRIHYGPCRAALHGAIIRAGMLRALLQTWAAYTRKSIDRAELRARLWAYGRVLGIIGSVRAPLVGAHKGPPPR
jgi:GT2 family glycosyltransferase